MSNYGDIAAGLVTVLEANISGLQGFDHPTHSVQGFPAAIVLPEPVDTEIAFGGNSFTGGFRVVFLVSSADSAEGFAKLYDHIDTVAVNTSVVRAVRADPTLNGKVDSSDVTRIENIGQRSLWGVDYFGFDAIVTFVKSVT